MAESWASSGASLPCRPTHASRAPVSTVKSRRSAGVKDWYLCTNYRHRYPQTASSRIVSCWETIPSLCFFNHVHSFFNLLLSFVSGDLLAFSNCWVAVSKHCQPALSPHSLWALPTTDTTFPFCTRLRPGRIRLTMGNPLLPAIVVLMPF